MTRTMPTLQPFPLLADPDRYLACRWDLSHDADRRAYWLSLFRRHFPKLLDAAVATAAAEGRDGADTRRRGEAGQAQFFAWLDEAEKDPHRVGRLDILKICHARENALRQAGIDDAYRLAKAHENEAALALLPQHLAQVDRLPPGEQLLELTKGVFAGNIFDLGATSTTDRFHNRRVDFHEVFAQLCPRPWLVDDLDAWLLRLSRPPRHRAAVLFVDNAGCDVLLGMIPLARWLLAQGTDVILTANTAPTLNDVTHEELTDLIQQVAAFDAPIRQALAANRLELVPSGNGYPLIDLNQVSSELVEAINRRGVDLVILEGMGRAIESNLDAAFTCDTLLIGMIKDEGVAQSLGGKVYDLVLRFQEQGLGPRP